MSNVIPILSSSPPPIGDTSPNEQDTEELEGSAAPHGDSNDIVCWGESANAQTSTAVDTNENNSDCALQTSDNITSLDIDDSTSSSSPDDSNYSGDKPDDGDGVEQRPGGNIRGDTSDGGDEAGHVPDDSIDKRDTSDGGDEEEYRTDGNVRGVASEGSDEAGHVPDDLGEGGHVPDDLGEGGHVPDDLGEGGHTLNDSDGGKIFPSLL